MTRSPCSFFRYGRERYGTAWLRGRDGRLPLWRAPKRENRGSAETRASRLESISSVKKCTTPSFYQSLTLSSHLSYAWFTGFFFFHTSASQTFPKSRRIRRRANSADVPSSQSDDFSGVPQ